MVMGLFPGLGTVVQAAPQWNEYYWIGVDGLKGCEMLNNTPVVKIKFGDEYDEHLWAICGADGNELVLLSTFGYIFYTLYPVFSDAFIISE